MPFLFALILSIFILMQMTELPLMLIWAYYVFNLIFG